jgi:hypothetical protein
MRKKHRFDSLPIYFGRVETRRKTIDIDTPKRDMMNPKIFKIIIDMTFIVMPTLLQPIIISPLT